MKILFVTSSYAIGDYRGGGITTYAAEVANLYNHTNEIEVVICNSEQCTTEIPGIKTYHIVPYSELFSSAIKLLDIIKESSPQIIINSNVNLLSLVLPYISNSIKVISICHSLGSLETETSGMNHEYADVIVALSGFAKEHILKRFRINCREKVPVIPNFVASSPNAESLIKKKLRRDVLKIMFFGGGTGTKSPDLVARVVKGLLKTNLNFEFYWVGGTLPPFHRASLVHDIRQLVPKDKRVVFTGNLPHDEAKELIADADVFLLPSRREGCPMALLEAMRTGAIPIVADYKIANKEIITDRENGFVISHRHVNKWISTLIGIIKDKKKYSQMCWNAYSYYCENLSFSVWQDRMKDLLESPIAHKTREKVITNNAYRRKYHSLAFLLRIRRFQNFLKETLPAYLSMNIQYLIKHY